MSSDWSEERSPDRLRFELERRRRRAEDLLRHGLEAERRLERMRSTRTWRAGEAVGAAGTAEGLLALPARLLRALRAKPPAEEEPLNAAAETWAAPLDAADTRPAALVVTAFVGAGGAERVVLDVMQALTAEIRFVVAYSEPSADDWEGRFRAAASAIERVSSPAALADFAGRAGARIAILSSSPLGYEAAPLLASRGLKVFDIVHNTAEQGWLQESIRQDRCMDAHFAVGGAQRAALAAGGVPGSKIVLSPNGVDVEGRFRPEAYADRLEELRARFGVDPKRGVVCWVGRLSEEKDPLLFVDTVARLRELRPGGVQALMLGDGPQRLAVEAAIRRLGLEETIETLGVRDDTAEALAVSDVFVLPSRVEGSPITLLEAMGMGRAVVAADVGSVSEAVEDGRSGRLVRERSAAAFAAAAAELLESPERRRSLGAAARATVVERFNAADSADVYRRAMRKALRAEV